MCPCCRLTMSPFYCPHSSGHYAQILNSTSHNDLGLPVFLLYKLIIKTPTDMAIDLLDKNNYSIGDLS